MAVTPRTTGSGGNGFVAGVTATVPAGASPGDLLALVVSWSSPSGESMTGLPTGWTPSAASGTTSGCIRNGHTSMGVFYVICAASGANSPGSTVGMTLSAVTSAAWGIIAYQGAAATVAAAIEAEAVALESVAQGTHTTPMASVGQAVHLLQVVGDRAATTTTLWTPGSGETLEVARYYSAGTFGPTLMVSAKDVGAGSRGGNVETANQSDAAAVMWTVGLAPPATGSSAQTVFPIADTNTDASIVQTGGTPGQLYTTLDEPTLDTTDFTEFTQPDGTVFYGCRVGALTLPLSSLRVEAVDMTPNASTGSRKVQVRGTGSTVLIAERTFTGVSPTNWITEAFDLTPSEIAAIGPADAADLRIRFYPTAT